MIFHQKSNQTLHLHDNLLWEAFGHHFWTIWAPFWTFLTSSWLILELALDHVGVILGQSWGLLAQFGASWRHLWPSWIHLGAIMGLLVPSWATCMPHDPKIVQKWSQNGSKMVPKWSPNGPQMVKKKKHNNFKVIATGC